MKCGVYPFLRNDPALVSSGSSKKKKKTVGEVKAVRVITGDTCPPCVTCFFFHNCYASPIPGKVCLSECSGNPVLFFSSKRNSSARHITIR